MIFKELCLRQPEALSKYNHFSRKRQRFFIAKTNASTGIKHNQPQKVMDKTIPAGSMTGSNAFLPDQYMFAIIVAGRDGPTDRVSQIFIQSGHQGLLHTSMRLTYFIDPEWIGATTNRYNQPIFGKLAHPPIITDHIENF
jgi:hypothetical protein